MHSAPPPFSGFEFLIAWRYLRARRAEGGVSAMTWISFVGIALAVMALIATLAVRSGFRHEFVGTILGANPHISVEAAQRVDENGRIDRTLPDFATTAADLSAVPGVTSAVPVIRGQVLATANGRNAFAQVIGITTEDLAGVPLVAEPEVAEGELSRLDEGAAIGSGIAIELG
ncbi:MAG: ABC transporter permease, partial [Pseudomonadota bacterium]